MRYYALLVIRFIRTKFANFVPHKTRTFRIPFDTQVERIGTRMLPNAAFSSFPVCMRRCFYARIVIANSLSPIVIADTSKRLDKNDFSRAAINR